LDVRGLEGPEVDGEDDHQAIGVAARTETQVQGRGQGLARCHLRLAVARELLQIGVAIAVSVDVVLVQREDLLLSVDESVTVGVRVVNGAREDRALRPGEDRQRPNQGNEREAHADPGRILRADSYLCTGLVSHWEFSRGD